MSGKARETADSAAGFDVDAVLDRARRMEALLSRSGIDSPQRIYLSPRLKYASGYINVQ